MKRQPSKGFETYVQTPRRGIYLRWIPMFTEVPVFERKPGLRAFLGNRALIFAPRHIIERFGARKNAPRGARGRDDVER